MKALLLHPFDTYSDRALLLTGLACTLLGGYLGAVFNVRFDGVLDLHFTAKVPWFQPIAEIGIVLLCTTILLFLAGRICNPKTRIIDLFLTSMIARIPYYALPFFNANQKAYDLSQDLLKGLTTGGANALSFADIFYLAALSFAAIAALIWLIALLYNGYKTAAHAKQTKPILLFIAAVVVAEISSKLLINHFLQH